MIRLAVDICVQAACDFSVTDNEKKDCRIELPWDCQLYYREEICQDKS
jgi:hypothetical protein